MTTMTRAMMALQRGVTWVRTTINPHPFDPYEREPIYHGALASKALSDPRYRVPQMATRRPPDTARNHVRYPLD